MRQSECLKHGEMVLKNLQFLEIKTVENKTIFAQDPPYYAAILCHAEKETVYITISGKQAVKSNHLLQQIYAYFQHVVIQNNLCPLTSQNWQDCDDKTVKLQGYVPAPHQILQAPMLTMPNLSTMQQADASSSLLQNYMNVGNRQIILLSPQPITCLSGLEVIGRLQAIDLGGKPNTKSSYKGWAVYVDSVQCLQ
jgi:hypothetical protein